MEDQGIQRNWIKDVVFDGPISGSSGVCQAASDKPTDMIPYVVAIYIPQAAVYINHEEHLMKYKNNMYEL